MSLILPASKLNKLIENIENRYFNASDTVCLDRLRFATEGYRQWADKPVVIKRALTFRHILRNMTLDLKSNPVIAGNTSSAPRAWMIIPEFGIGGNNQVAVENDDLPVDWLEGKIPDEFIDFWKSQDQAGDSPGGVAGIGHMSLDFDRAVNHGLLATIAEIDRQGKRGTTEEQEYRSAMKISCEAVIEWSKRYAEAAKELSESSNDPLLKDMYLRTAEACEQVPAKPPRTYFEALQSMLLIHLASIIEGMGMSQSIGLPDRVLAGFSNEVSNNFDAVVSDTRAFLIGVMGNSFLGRGSKTQAITLGGADADGNDCCNAVTLAFLEAFALTPVADPHCFLRWHNKLDPKVWNRTLKILSQGRSMPMLINDHIAVPGLENSGIASEDAWNYCVVGCNEVGIPGLCCQSGFSLGLGFVDIHLLHKVLDEAPSSYAGCDAILEAYSQRVYRSTQSGIAQRKRRTEELAELVPFPFCSACCRGSIEKGKDYLLAMPYPEVYGLFIRGTTNAVNALTSIDEIVFKKREISLSRYLEKLDSEDPALIARIKNVPRWGQDNDEADKWAAKLSRKRREAVNRAAEEAGVPSPAICHVVRSLHHLGGRNFKASADGRKAGTPLCDSIGAEHGSADSPTSVLNSVLKLDPVRDYAGFYNLNITLPGGSPSAPGVLKTLAESFFKQGGQELQFNVFDSSKLEDARKHPERHRDLVVRIAGLNARFVELSAAEQAEIISRAQYASGKKTDGC